MKIDSWPRCQYKQATSKVITEFLVTPHFSGHCCLPRCYKNIPLNPVYDIQLFSIPEFQTPLHSSPKQSWRPKSHTVRCINTSNPLSLQLLPVSASSPLSWTKDSVRTNLEERGCIYLVVAGHIDIPPWHGSHICMEGAWSSRSHYICRHGRVTNACLHAQLVSPFVQCRILRLGNGPTHGGQSSLFNTVKTILCRHPQRWALVR